MTKYYKDYYWKDGLPQGIQHIPEEIAKEGVSYKIPSDPYHRRLCIEKYNGESFVEVVYDSALFNFRHLHPVHQTAWQKTLIHETDTDSICHIRNQDDRLVLIENYRFEQGLCRECSTTSPHGILVSIQKISYTALGDPFNGVILYDSNDHAVMSKKYQFDVDSQEFTDLLEEQWIMRER